ncbi:hypothetical protein M5D96_000984 [Drosophila gunungcola]|uniref:Uncharacterized protein n=1 Tax=Drosophila gunungcola TaxID=103775 RepID=A0A9Q0BU96_9MUSC|nr:hypothetical protein M5D96_000984 [Drosophila gunungcola]
MFTTLNTPELAASAERDFERAESESAREWSLSGAALSLSHVACGSQTQVFGESGFWPHPFFHSLACRLHYKSAKKRSDGSGRRRCYRTRTPNPIDSDAGGGSVRGGGIAPSYIIFIFISCMPSVALHCSDDIVVVAALQR